MREERYGPLRLCKIPPWDWPGDAGKKFHEVLIDRQANETDRLIAAELAGDLTVINDELADALTAIIRRSSVAVIKRMSFWPTRPENGQVHRKEHPYAIRHHQCSNQAATSRRTGRLTPYVFFFDRA